MKLDDSDVVGPLAAGEPDFLRHRIPRERRDELPVRGQDPRLPGEVDDPHGLHPPALAFASLCDEVSDLLAVRQKPQGEDVCVRGGRNEHLPDRELELIVAHDGQTVLARSVVRDLRGELERLGWIRRDELPRRASGEGDLGDRGGVRAVKNEDRELAGRRDREQVGARQRKGRRLRRIHPRRIDPGGLSLPGGGVEDRLAVRRDSRVPDRAAMEAHGAGTSADPRAFSAGRSRRLAAPTTRPAIPRTRPSRDGRFAAGSGGGGSREAPVGEAVAQPRQVVREISRRCIALLALLREAALHDPAQRHGGARRRLGQRFRLLADDRRHRLRRARAREGAPARDHFVEHRSEGKLVRPEIENLAERLLRRHVADRPQHDAGLRRGRDRRRLRHLARLAGRRRQLRQGRSRGS